MKDLLIKDDKLISKIVNQRLNKSENIAMTVMELEQFATMVWQDISVIIDSLENEVLENDVTTIGELEPGSIFRTVDEPVSYGFKTEYSTDGNPDCYCYETGEYFGAADLCKKYGSLRNIPIVKIEL